VRAAEPDGGRRLIHFSLHNTGAAMTIPDGVHPRRRDEAFASDVYRVSATIEGQGWSVDLPYPLAAVRAGQVNDAYAFTRQTNTAAREARLTIRAVSESDPSKIATATLTLRR
jgi:hypothetical protein